MNIFSIKDLELLSGIKAHTIRIWETRYDFLKPQRTETRIRFYSNAELKTVLNISLLNRYGYRISEINKMTPEEIKTKIITLTHVEAHQDRVVNDMINNMIDIKPDDFEASLDTYIAHKGIEKAVNNVIFEFLERVGLLWQTSHINPAQEHLVINIIRQKLILGIEKLPKPINYKKNVVLFSPEGEFHEISLLFLYFMLKSNGIKVTYLGANVPLKDVSFINEMVHPDYIFSHITALGQNFNLEKFLLKLSTIVTNKNIILTGPLTQGYKKFIPEGIQIKNSLSEVVDKIESIKK